METLPRDVLLLIFDVVQQSTQNARKLSSVSKRWAAIFASNHARYPALLHHVVVLLAEDGAHDLYQSLSQTTSISNSSLSPPSQPRSFTTTHNNIALHFVHYRRPEEAHAAVASPLIDAVVIPVSCIASEYTAALSPYSVIRTLFPMPLRVKVIVAVTRMDAVAYGEDHFQRLCAHFDSVLKIAPARMTRVLVPVCLQSGAGVRSRYEAVSWYNGPSLFDALATPYRAPFFALSTSPLLLICANDCIQNSDNNNNNSNNNNAANQALVWVRVFRRKLCASQVLYRFEESFNVLRVETSTGTACEGSFVRVLLSGAQASTCNVGDVLDASPATPQLSFDCSFSVGRMPGHTPLFTPGLSCVLCAHFCTVEVEIDKLLLLKVGPGRAKKRPLFIKSHQQALCRMTLKAPVWFQIVEKGSQSGFDAVFFRLEGTIIAHGRILQRTQQQETGTSV